MRPATEMLFAMWLNVSGKCSEYEPLDPFTLTDTASKLIGIGDNFFPFTVLL